MGFKFILVLLSLLNSISTTLAVAGNPGHPCVEVNQEAHCMTSTTGLICPGNLSKCECPVESTWDDTAKKCIVGGSCTVGGNNCQKFTECIEVTPGYLQCKCKPGTVDTGTSTTVCKATMGNSCDVTETLNPDCDSASYLTCDTNNLCACSNGLKDNGAGLCRAALSDSCSSDLPCDENAAIVCVNNICTCQEGRKWDWRANKCTTWGTLGDKCSLSEPCDETLHLYCAAITNVCKCRNSYVEEDGLCRVQLGDSCEADRDCVKFALCDRGNCFCQDGFSEMTTGKCRVVYDGICNIDEHCDQDTLYLRCSPLTKRCNCMVGFRHTGTHDGCRVATGSNCILNNQCETGTCTKEKCM